MKKFIIYLLLIVLLCGTGCGVYYGIQYYNLTSASTEEPVDPETPVDPDVPVDPETPVEPDEPGTDEPEDPVVTTSISDFKFNGNTITSYIGEATEVVVPASYSLGELKTITYQVEDGMVVGEDIIIDEIIMPILESGQTVKFIFADDSSVEVDFDEYFMDPAMSMEAVAVEIQEYEFIEGDDIQITTLEGTFEWNKTIVSVDLSHTSVTKLSGTFNHCTSLENILLPATIEEITHGCFNACTFESIDLSNTNLKVLGGFEGSSIKTITLPDTLEELEQNTFYFSDLETIDLSNTQITSIPFACFGNCDKLISVILPSTVTTIAENSFSKCSATIYLPANLLDSFKITYPDLADRFVAID